MTNIDRGLIGACLVAAGGLLATGLVAPLFVALPLGAVAMLLIGVAAATFGSTVESGMYGVCVPHREEVPVTARYAEPEPAPEPVAVPNWPRRVPEPSKQRVSRRQKIGQMSHKLGVDMS